MINSSDPSEWLYQIEATPATAPAMVSLLVSRLKSLDEENERLRDTNIELRTKIDTNAHQREVAELQRQIRTFARLTRARMKPSEMGNVLLAWSDNGHVFAVDWKMLSAGQPIILPPLKNLADTKLGLLSVPATEDVLFVTNGGLASIFEVQALVGVTRESANWHRLPDIVLSSNESISLMSPIGDLPLSSVLTIASRGGFIRGILRWSLDRLLQEGKLGTGVHEEWDSQAFAQLVLDNSSDVVLFTRHGKYLRFQASNVAPNLTQGIKLDYDDQLAGMIMVDSSESQVLLVDAEGKGARRPVGSLPRSSIGLKAKSAVLTDNLVGAGFVNAQSKIAVLTAGSQPKLLRIDASQVPLFDHSRALSVLAGINEKVSAFAVAKYSDQ